MFRFFSKKPTSTHTKNHGFRPQLETLEDRRLMSTFGDIPAKSPIVEPTPTKSPIVIIGPIFTPPQQVARPVDLVTVPRQMIADSLSSTTDVDLFSVQLQQGDFLQAYVQTAATLKLSSTMTILDTHGNVLATIGASRNPLTGIMSTNPAYGFVAPETGKYQIKITSGPSASTTSKSTAISLQAGSQTGAYSLNFHRLALAQGIQSFETLAKTGGMYAFLKDGKLDIVGPTGYGFAIGGNWSQSVTSLANGLYASTYVATSGVSLETSAGPVDLTVTAGTQFTVTTKANTFGDHVGQISGLSFKTTVSAGAMMKPFAINSPFGFDLSKFDKTITVTGQLGGVAGIGMGSSAKLKLTGAPLNNAIPYLYPRSTHSAPARPTRQRRLRPGRPGPLHRSRRQGHPHRPARADRHRHVQARLHPYTPINAPSQYTGNIGGNLVLQGSLDTTSITMVPSKIQGDLTLNLDPNHTGQLFGGCGVTAAGVAGIFAMAGAGAGTSFLGALGATDTPLGSDLGQLFRNFYVGINGTLMINPLADLQKDLNWAVGNQILMLPTKPDGFVDGVLNFANDKTIGNTDLLMLKVGKGSLIYDGPNASFYFRGSTINPFKGTVLESFASPYSVDLDVAVKSGGQFFLDAKGSYKYMGMTMKGEVLIAKDYPVIGPAANVLTNSIWAGCGGCIGTGPKVTGPILVSGIYLKAEIHLLTANVELTGKMYANGDFSITGSSDASIGALKGSQSFTLSNTQATGFSFIGTMDGHFKSDYIRCDVDATLKLKIVNGQVKYSGTASASGEVKVPVWGWEGGSLSAGIDNHNLWVKVGGHKVKFAW